MRRGAAILASVIVAVVAGRSAMADINLTNAVLLVPKDATAREQKAAVMLIEEVQKRSRVRWSVEHEWRTDVPVVSLGRQGVLVEPASGGLDEGTPPGAEGFRLVSRGGASPSVYVCGVDERGVLFGAGRLLRELRMAPGSVRLAEGLNLSTAPKYPLRGHQLGYRPKTNSYDAWTADMWEQYIRDLAIFGNNAVELIPPRSDDAPDSPHFPEPQIDMMEKMSRICDEYGIDVWIWYPALDKDYADPAQVEFALKEWGAVFARLPRIDHILVPGGDPGHTPVAPLMNLLEKETEVLHRTHPKAGMWVSPQGFGRAWTDEFTSFLQTKRPAWLTGVVFAPQNFDSLEVLRKAVPEQYPIRHYPDITHTVRCQFPVPDWDYAFAITEQREPINPRPVDYANIFRTFQPYTNGFITYSEGCNDDVNKIVWSCLGWDPDMPVFDALRSYAKFFIGDRYEYSFAQGLLALEENWRGPLLTNYGVDTTLELFRQMERDATPQERLNWRFQQALYRAYYDAYNRRKLIHETALEEAAMDVLRKATLVNVTSVLDEAERILDRSVLEPAGQDLRARVFELAEALYQSVRMQLSVPRYQAIDIGRGANLDLIDVPFNDRLWLKAQFAEIRRQVNDRDKLVSIDALVNWSNPGPGGFYDDLGNLTRQPHLVRDPQAPDNRDPFIWHGDPEFRRMSQVGFEFDLSRRMSWVTQAESRFDAPLVLHYDHLEPGAEYTVRVIYGGEAGGTPDNPVKVRLEIDHGIELHPYMVKPRPPKPLEFDIPKEATSDGELTLRFTRDPGRGGNGRGCQVAEVWLMKKTGGQP